MENWKIGDVYNYSTVSMGSLFSFFWYSRIVEIFSS